MTPEKWKKVKSVLEQAIEIAPESRADFLDKTCLNDLALRKEVENLLDFDNTKSDILEQNAFSAVMENGKGDFLGKQIGNYKIVGELGTGGMGAVFLAERSDGAFNQKVALKLIKRGMDSDAVLRRFFNERQILASLEHPNIAHLVDGGTTDDDLPYFVMEYVEGETITDYARRENLDLEERLELFRQVCAAVSFAHSNLVIHRDLKPSNILITKDGTPKLLDFGIAKLLKSDATDATTAAQMQVFTPEYASPEQVKGEKLTTATDVYSLGVILYELLTGNRPCKTESKNVSDIIKAVCESQPKLPSSVISPKSEVRSPKSENQTSANEAQRTKDKEQKTNPQSQIPNPKSLRGDLDNIILKALRKEPERRYLSVEQFSEDIRRHLIGLPVTASKDTFSYRASKFVRRNRVGVAAFGLILLTLIGGLAATLYQRNKAEQRFNDVRQLANSFLFEFHDAIKDLPGATPARELVVKRALEYLDKLAAESAGDPTLQRELATAYAEIGQIQGNSYHSNLGDTDGALKSYRRSLEIRQKLAEAEPNNLELQHELADSYEGVGDILYTMNDLKGGLENYETAVAIREKITSAEPKNPEYRYSLAGVLGKRGDIKGMEGFPNLGDTDGALESYRKVIPLYEELVKTEPNNEKYKLGYATSLHFYGMLKSVTGDATSAIADGQKAVSIFESLIAADPNNAKYETHLMSALVFLRYPLLDENRTAEAVENARRVVQTMEKQSAADPKNAFAKRSLSVSYNSLGICLLQSGDAQAAIENHKKSLEIIEALSAADTDSGEHSRDLALTLEYLAKAQLEANEIDSALANYRKSLAVVEKNKDVNKSDDLISLYMGIGKSLAAKGDLTNAAGNYRIADLIADEFLQNPTLNLKTKVRYATAFFDAGRVFEKIAQTGNDGKSRAESCKYYKRSYDLWSEIRKAGTLSNVNAGRPDEAAKEMADCK